MRDPGEYNRRVTLGSVTRTPDGGGGYTETAVAGATVWAKVEPLQGNEKLQAMQTGMRRPHRFFVPYRDGVTGTTSLTYLGRTFDVQSVIDPDAAHEELEILADEVVP